MTRFKTTLVAGRKPPYSSWTFLVIPRELAKAWGPGHKAVRGTIAGHPFQGTASRGEGALRVPIPKPLREAAGIRRGDAVEVTLELDQRLRTIEVPAELEAVFKKDPEAAALFDQLPPAHRRAWASWVAEAKRSETRERRAAKAPQGIRDRAFPR